MLFHIHGLDDPILLRNQFSLKMCPILEQKKNERKIEDLYQIFKIHICLHWLNQCGI